MIVRQTSFQIQRSNEFSCWCGVTIGSRLHFWPFSIGPSENISLSLLHSFTDCRCFREWRKRLGYRL